MSDAFDFYMAEKYENETLRFARENSHIAETMLVRVHDEVEGVHCIGHGIVMRDTMRWSEFLYQWVADIDMGAVKLRNVPAGRLERAVGAELRVV